MKKIMILMLLVVFCVILFACDIDTRDWQTIDFATGTIAVPQKWKVNNSNELLSFYNGNDLCAFQSYSFCGFKGELDSIGDIEKNAFSSKFQSIYVVSSNILSNGAVFGEALVSVDDKEQKISYLEFGENENTLLLYIVPNMVSEEDFINIAKSFKSN